MFTKARLILTAWYLFIIMLISVFFSVIIYRVLTQEVERFGALQRTRIERRIQDQLIIPELPPPDLHRQISTLDPDLINETKQRILFTLIFINGSIVIIAGALGYILSGKTLKPIATMMEEQHRFVSDASHELRTPLTALKSNLEVNLRNTKLSLEEAKQTLRESVEDADNLERLSDKLLSLSQFESNYHKTDFSSVNTADVIRYAVRAITPLADKKHIRILSHAEPVTIIGNMHDLQDLCITLLDNAIKYSHERSTASIRSTGTQKELMIAVTDHGIGIAKQDIPHIFDRFFRADAARSTANSKGYGLGLAIAKRIIDGHHGTIRVESVLRKGSTFTITLPKHQPA